MLSSRMMVGYCAAVRLCGCAAQAGGTVPLVFPQHAHRKRVFCVGVHTSVRGLDGVHVVRSMLERNVDGASPTHVEVPRSARGPNYLHEHFELHTKHDKSPLHT